MTVAEWFDNNFQNNKVEIDGMKAWGKQEMVRAYFPTDNNGSLFVHCGGQCIMAFELNRIAGKAFPLYLVVESGRYRNDGDSRDRLSLHQSA